MTCYKFHGIRSFCIICYDTYIFATSNNEEKGNAEGGHSEGGNTEKITINPT